MIYFLSSFFIFLCLLLFLAGLFVFSYVGVVFAVVLIADAAVVFVVGSLDCR